MLVGGRATDSRHPSSSPSSLGLRSQRVLVPPLHARPAGPAPLPGAARSRPRPHRGPAPPGTPTATALAPVPARAASDTVFFSDDFSSGLGAWEVVQGGNGTVGTTSVVGPSGATTQVAQMTVPDYTTARSPTSASGSTSPVYALSAVGWFKVRRWLRRLGRATPPATCRSSASSTPTAAAWSASTGSTARAARPPSCTSSTAAASSAPARTSASATGTSSSCGRTVNGGDSLVQVYMNDIKVYEARPTTGSCRSPASRSTTSTTTRSATSSPTTSASPRSARRRRPTPATRRPRCPTNAYPGTTVIADNFESFNLEQVDRHRGLRRRHRHGRHQRRQAPAPAVPCSTPLEHAPRGPT